MDGWDDQIRAALALIDTSFAAEQVARGWAGMSAAIVLDQTTIWSNSYGHANIADQIPATSRTLYSIASITKLFTVTMLMQLRDAGKVQLDDPVGRYDPTFIVPPLFPTTRPITFRHLASHTAGLQKDFPFPISDTQVIPPIDDLLATLPAMPPVAPPMVMFKYSNIGMACLGHALERIADQPYPEYVLERITRPLGMADSRFAIDDESRSLVAVGYTPPRHDRTPQLAPYFPNYNIGGLVATGGLYASVEDIARFMAMQFRDGPPGDAQVLDGMTIREMHAPVMLRGSWEGAVGLGWWLGRVAGETWIGHGGDHSGFNADIKLIPSQKLGIAVFANTNGDPGALTTAALEVLVPVVRRTQRCKASAASGIPTRELDKYVGDYGERDTRRGMLEVRLIDGELVGHERDTSGESVIFELIEGNSFRMRGGFLTGECVSFEEDEKGRVTRLRYNAFARPRTSP